VCLTNICLLAFTLTRYPISTTSDNGLDWQLGEAGGSVYDVVADYRLSRPKISFVFVGVITTSVRKSF
jgi:hypothetical protein